MGPRDVFDGLLLTFACIVVYVELVGLTFSRENTNEVVDAILGIDTIFVLVFAGVLGVAFVGYITLYMPLKQSKNPPKEGSS